MATRTCETWLMDMDGVIVREGDLVPERTAMGLDVPSGAIRTSAPATARLLDEQRPGGSAFAIGEAGLTTALHEAGAG